MNQQPWLKKDGTLKSDAEIKESCKSWKPLDWENYLQTLEAEQKEVIMDDPLDLEQYSQEEHDQYMDILGSSREFPVLEKHLLKAMESLTSKQQMVLHKLFWEKMGLRALAREMSIAPSSVVLIKDRALKQLGGLLINNLLSMSGKVPKEAHFPNRVVG